MPRNNELEKTLTDILEIPKAKPTRIRREVKDVQKRLLEFNAQAVLLGEFPSLQNTSNQRPMEVADITSCSSWDAYAADSINLEESNRNKTKENVEYFIKKVNDESRIAATQVMAYILGDLDRIQLPDEPHSICTGYVLRASSCSNLTMRKVREDFLNEMHKRNLHVPVTISDGEWYSLMAQDSNGIPLTEGQLKRDVFKKTKKESRKEIMKSLSEMNNVDAYDITMVRNTHNRNVYVNCQLKAQSPQPVSTPKSILTKVSGFEKSNTRELFFTDYAGLLSKLTEYNNTKWGSKGEKDLKEFLMSNERLCSREITVKELNICSTYMASKGFSMKSTTKRKSDIAGKIVDVVCGFRNYSPSKTCLKSLKQLAFDVLVEKKEIITLNVLRHAMAKSLYVAERSLWVESTNERIPPIVSVYTDKELMEFKTYYRPAYIETRNQLELCKYPFFQLHFFFILM